jgi:hypothetical protein
VTDESDLPPDLEAIDRSLREIRFVPRASFGTELLGRLRHGERSKGVVLPGRSRRALAGLAALLLVAAVALVYRLHRSPPPVLLDRCCYDLDGGGQADDGVTLRLAGHSTLVSRLRVYEDRDRSRTFSPGDVVRLDRRNKPVMRPGITSGLVTVDHCCLDFDGSGLADDALLVIGVPPDRVMMAAIYERGADRRASHKGSEPYLLR